MEPEQKVLSRLASLEGLVVDIRAVVTLLLAARPLSPPCADVPLPLFVRITHESRPSHPMAMHARCRSFWL